MGLDVGPESIAQFTAVIERAVTIIWNGPVGVFEFEKFSSGSKTVLEAVVAATKKGATSIIGVCVCVCKIFLLENKCCGILK